MNKNQLIHWTSAMLLVCGWAESSSAHDLKPNLEFKFTDGSSASTGSNASDAEIGCATPPDACR